MEKQPIPEIFHNEISSSCKSGRNLYKEVYPCRGMASKDKFSAYLTANLEEYKGKWIILCDEHVIASGEDIKTLVRKARQKYPNKKILLARVPQEGTMIL
jgi:hypothetical protein